MDQLNERWRQNNACCNILMGNEGNNKQLRHLEIITTHLEIGTQELNMRPNSPDDAFTWIDINKDTVLLKEVAYTKSDLVLARDTIFADICRLVVSRARKYMEQLSYFGPTQVMTEQLKALLSDYVNNLTGTKREQNLKTISTSDLSELFSEGDHILRVRLDGLMLFIKESAPMFYEQYCKARKRPVNGNPHKSTDESNEVGLAA